MRCHVLPLLGAAVLAVTPAARATSEYPNRPVRIVVGFAPGGNVDTPTRIVARRLSDLTGVPVIVENKPGAGGNIAAESVARAQPDGYTLLACGGTSHGANSALYARLPYDPVKDFAPITMLGTVPNVLVVHPSLAASDFAGFVAWMKADPARANIASAGVGTSQHLAIELLKSSAGFKATHVPYKGGATALADVVGGHVPAMIAGMPTALPSIRAGKVRALALTSARRSPQLPDVPTLAESGVPGYDVTNWVGLCAPSGIAPARLARLVELVQVALKTPEIHQGLADIGYQPAPIDPAELSAFIRRDIAKWMSLAREAGINPE